MLQPTARKKTRLVTFVILLNYWLVIVGIWLITQISITTNNLIWAGVGFFAYFLIVRLGNRFLHFYYIRYKRAKGTFMIYRIKKAISNPYSLRRLQPKITRSVEFDYFTYFQMEFLFLHGGRNPEDLQDDMETYIKFRSKADEFDQALNLMEMIYPHVEEQYDFLYGIFQTILHMEAFSLRIQNVVGFLVRLNSISPLEFKRFHLFQEAELTDSLLNDCTSEDDYGLLFDQLVLYYIETELNSSGKFPSPGNKLLELQGNNGNIILDQIWQEIVDHHGQFISHTQIKPIEQFHRVNLILKKGNITAHDQYHHLMSCYSHDHKFGFLEYCCLTPEIYDRLHSQVKWPELETTYHTLYNLPLSEERGIIL